MLQNSLASHRSHRWAWALGTLVAVRDAFGVMIQMYRWPHSVGPECCHVEATVAASLCHWLCHLQLAIVAVTWAHTLVCKRQLVELVGRAHTEGMTDAVRLVKQPRAFIEDDVSTLEVLHSR